MRLFQLISIYFILLFLPGCSGCSSSGRKRIALPNSESGRTATNTTKREKKPPSVKPSNWEATEIEVDESKSINPDFETVYSNVPLSELFKELRPSVFLIYTANDEGKFQGTGFFISSSGLGISNYHVFEGTTIGKERIKTYAGNEYKIEEVLYKSSKYDFILFQVNSSKKLKYLNIANKSLDVGDEVFAIGNPQGLEHTLSKGIVSGYRDNYNLLQTTAEITHGSSGGPLFNMKGEVIGITTSGAGEANLNFAINIQKIKQYFPKLVSENQESNVDKKEVLVKRVIDGDTFEIESGEKVRLIGIDTPETKHPRKGVEPFGKEASQMTKSLVENRNVLLEFDVDQRDRYGRLLCYVYYDNKFLNEELVKAGLAKVATYPPNVKYVDLFVAAQKEAQNKEKNIWSF